MFVDLSHLYIRRSIRQPAGPPPLTVSYVRTNLGDLHHGQRALYLISGNIFLLCHRATIGLSALWSEANVLVLVPHVMHRVYCLFHIVPSAWLFAIVVWYVKNRAWLYVLTSWLGHKPLLKTLSRNWLVHKRECPTFQ